MTTINRTYLGKFVQYNQIQSELKHRDLLMLRDAILEWSVIGNFQQILAIVQFNEMATILQTISSISNWANTL